MIKHGIRVNKCNSHLKVYLLTYCQYTGLVYFNAILPSQCRKAAYN